MGPNPRANLTLHHFPHWHRENALDEIHRVRGSRKGKNKTKRQLAPLECTRRKYRVRVSRKEATKPNDHWHRENALDEIHRVRGSRKGKNKPPDTWRRRRNERRKKQSHQTKCPSGGSFFLSTASSTIFSCFSIESCFCSFPVSSILASGADAPFR